MLSLNQLRDGVKRSSGPSYPCLLFLMEDTAVYVRPEYFEDKRSTIQAHVQQPALAGLGPCTIDREVVKVGNARSCARADDLRSVECRASRVHARDQHAAKRIHRTLEESTVSQRVIAWVLVQRGRKEKLYLVVFVCLIDEGVPVVTPVSSSSLVKLRR